MPSDFWSYFDTKAIQLNERAVSMRLVFQYLDGFDPPIHIIETGCIRQEDNWGGDGQSTILFDHYVCCRGGHVWSVDVDSEAVDMCRRLTSLNVTVVQSDSIKFLEYQSKYMSAQRLKLHLCYLDSFDLDWQDSLPSAQHHLDELAAIRPAIDNDTLIVVDDSPVGSHTLTKNILPHNNLVVGKGQMIAQYFQNLGIQPVWTHYQSAWKGL